MDARVNNIYQTRQTKRDRWIAGVNVNRRADNRNAGDVTAVRSGRRPRDRSQNRRE